MLRQEKQEDDMLGTRSMISRPCGRYQPKSVMNATTNTLALLGKNLINP